MLRTLLTLQKPHIPASLSICFYSLQSKENLKDPEVPRNDVHSVMVNQVSKHVEVPSSNTNVQLNQVSTQVNSNIKSSNSQETVSVVGKNTCPRKDVQKQDDR
jgi:hypothetical protein